MHLQGAYNGLQKFGKLLKRLRDENKFAERRFELDGRQNYLRYFNKDSAKAPKNSLDLERLNVTFVLPEAAMNARMPSDTMHITYVIEGITRNIFVTSDRTKDLLDWYQAIRCAKYNRIMLNMAAMGGADPEVVSGMLSYDHLIEGMLEKTGARANDSWRKRYCRLGRRRLMYCEKQTDAFGKGEIFLGEFFNLVYFIKFDFRNYCFGFNITLPNLMSLKT